MGSKWVLWMVTAVLVLRHELLYQHVLPELTKAIAPGGAYDASEKPDRAPCWEFRGSKAVRMAGQYLRDHGAVVNVFYISNVEDYIHPQALQRASQSVWDAYAANIASLPADSSSLFVRWTSLFRGTLPSPWLASIADFVRTGDRKMPPDNLVRTFGSRVIPAWFRFLREAGRRTSACGGSRSC
jgi:hypothetical protein